MSKPTWYAEPTENYWLIQCRFKLGAQNAGLCETLSFAAGIDLASVVIQQMEIRRQRFIAEELNHA